MDDAKGKSQPVKGAAEQKIDSMSCYPWWLVEDDGVMSIRIRSHVGCMIRCMR
jgi:hypothetical protein